MVIRVRKKCPECGGIVMLQYYRECMACGKKDWRNTNGRDIHNRCPRKSGKRRFGPVQRKRVKCTICTFKKII